MNKKFNVIKISGFKGIMLFVFIIGCLAAGFLIFPGWICLNLWNFVAGYFPQMPLMSMVHGVMLWGIIALSVYALNNGNFAVSLSSSPSAKPNEAKIKEIIRQINEKNANILPAKKTEDVSDEIEENIENDKFVK